MGYSTLINIQNIGLESKDPLKRKKRKKKKPLDFFAKIKHRKQLGNEIIRKRLQSNNTTAVRGERKKRDIKLFIN